MAGVRRALKEGGAAGEIPRNFGSFGFVCSAAFGAVGAKTARGWVIAERRLQL